MMIKNILKAVLTDSYYLYLQRKKHATRALKNLLYSYYYDFIRYYRNANIDWNDTTPTRAIALIIMKYHVIEKGLTMPQRRLGFGKGILMSLVSDCESYISKYGSDDEQLLHAMEVIMEYRDLHHSHQYDLGKELSSSLENFRKAIPFVNRHEQRAVTRDQYFSFSQSSFSLFSNSRSSIRNYSAENIPINTLLEVLNLARNTPSACNRQSWRSYVYLNKTDISEILKVQGGNRGFGHLVNKLIIVTGELGVFGGGNGGERNQVYIDGGIYVMNALLALHHYKIGACVLNCSNTPDNDKRLRKLCKIKESEVFIAMIACGIPPEQFSIASSKRYDLQKTNTVIE